MENGPRDAKLVMVFVVYRKFLGHVWITESVSVSSIKMKWPRLKQPQECRLRRTYLYPEHVEFTSGMSAVLVAGRVLTTRSPAWHPNSECKASDASHDRRQTHLSQCISPVYRKKSKKGEFFHWSQCDSKKLCTNSHILFQAKLTCCLSVIPHPLARSGKVSDI